MLKVARLTDLVLHKCGPCPITSGSPMFNINTLPNARVTDSISCGGVLVTGSATFSDQMHRSSRITDLGVCPPPCGTGVVITGAPMDFET